MQERKSHIETNSENVIDTHDTLLDGNKDALALDTIENEIITDPSNIQAHSIKLNTLVNMGLYQHGLAVIDLLKTITGATRPLLHTQVFCLYELGKYKEAKKLINLYSDEFSDSIEALSIYGMSTFKLGNAKGAKKFFDSVFSHDLSHEQNPHVIALYSQALIFTGEYYEATCLLNNIPTSYFYLSVCKGDAYFGLKKYKEAEKEYQDALLMNPNTFSAYFGLGKVNYQTRQYSESLKYFRSAEKLRPDDIHVMIEINNLQQMMALENNINIQGGEEKKSEPSPPATLPESTPAASSTDADKKNDSDSKDAKFESSPLAQPKKINTESKSEKRPVAMPKNMREVDVPNDNNCLFWSIIMGYLLPTLDHYAKFETAFQNIIGEKCKTTLEKKLSGENAKQAIFRLLKTYDVDKNSDIYKIPIMVNFSQLLRHRTVTEMTRYFSKEHKDELAKDVRKANWRQYARWMRSDSAWGGESEIKAISNILKKSITVYSKKYMIEYEYKSHDNPLYLVYTNATGNTHVTNHYHYLLDEALYKKHLRKESTLSTSAHSSLFKPKEKEKENDSESEKLKEQWVDQFIHLYF